MRDLQGLGNGEAEDGGGSKWRVFGEIEAEALYQTVQKPINILNS